MFPRSVRFATRSVRTYTPLASSSSSSSSSSSAAAAATNDATKSTTKGKKKVAKIGGIRPDGRSKRWYRAAGVMKASLANASTTATASTTANTSSSSSSSPSSSLSSPFDTTEDWLIQLDGRTVLTPSELELKVPSLPLAMLVAAEWERQGDRVLPHTMPMMTLCTTLLDEAPSKRTVIIGNLCSFLQADTACIRSTDKDICAEQDRLLTPLVQWFQKEFNTALNVSDTAGAFTGKTKQSEETIQAMQFFLFGLSDAALVALEGMAQCTKSLLLPVAVHFGKCSAEDIFNASRVEEDWNLRKWGEATGPGGSDTDAADLRVRISSAALFSQLTKSL